MEATITLPPSLYLGVQDQEILPNPSWKEPGQGVQYNTTPLGGVVWESGRFVCFPNADLGSSAVQKHT